MQTLTHLISAGAFHPNQWHCPAPNELLPPSACLGRATGLGCSQGSMGLPGEGMLSWQHLTGRQWHHRLVLGTHCKGSRGVGLFWEHTPIGHWPPINEARDAAHCPAAYLAVDINCNLLALPPNNYGKGWALAIKRH